jgi:hypothetical protein
MTKLNEFVSLAVFFSPFERLDDGKICLSLLYVARSFGLQNVTLSKLFGFEFKGILACLSEACNLLLYIYRLHV